MCRESTYLHVMYCLVSYYLEGRPLQKKKEKEKEKENIINIGKTGHNNIWVMEIRLCFHQKIVIRESQIF